MPDLAACINGVLNHWVCEHKNNLINNYRSAITIRLIRRLQVLSLWQIFNLTYLWIFLLTFYFPKTRKLWIWYQFFNPVCPLISQMQNWVRKKMIIGKANKLNMHLLVFYQLSSSRLHHYGVTLYISEHFLFLHNRTGLCLTFPVTKHDIVMVSITFTVWKYYNNIIISSSKLCGHVCILNEFFSSLT